MHVVGRALSLGLLPDSTGTAHAPAFLILGSFSLVSDTTLPAFSFSKSSKMLSSERTCSCLVGFAAGAVYTLDWLEWAEQKTTHPSGSPRRWSPPSCVLMIVYRECDAELHQLARSRVVCGGRLHKIHVRCGLTIVTRSPCALEHLTSPSPSQSQLLLPHQLRFFHIHRCRVSSFWNLLRHAMTTSKCHSLVQIWIVGIRSSNA